jgi:hypothetical protein
MTVTPIVLVDDVQVADTLTNYFAAGPGVTVRIDKATLCNDAASPITVSINLIPSGGSADATNQVVKDKAIAAGETYSLGAELGGHILEAGDAIHAVASTAAEVALRISGMQFS